MVLYCRARNVGFGWTMGIMNQVVDAIRRMRDSHGPAEDDVPRPAIKVSHLFDDGPLDAGVFLDLIPRRRFYLFDESLEAFGVCKKQAILRLAQQDAFRQAQEQ